MSGSDPQAQTRLDAVFAALADPTRRALVTALLTGDRTVTALAEPFPISLAAVSKHLTILIRAGIVTQRREGRVKWCRLEPDSLRPAAIWMEAFGGFDEADLDALETLFETATAPLAPTLSEPNRPEHGPADSP